MCIDDFSSYCSSVGLKHVSDDQKIHKNPNLRLQATPIKTKSPETVNSPRAAVQKKTPLLELEGKKWRVVREMFTFFLRDDSQRKIWYFIHCRKPLPLIICVICSLLLLQENFEQKHDLAIEETELKQVVYVFNCNNSTLQIKGKINSIIVGELPENRLKVML